MLFPFMIPLPVACLPAKDILVMCSLESGSGPLHLACSHLLLATCLLSYCQSRTPPQLTQPASEGAASGPLVMKAGWS